jgi:hypothetical protein
LREIVVNVRYTLKQLGSWAVDEVGFCAGMYWRTVSDRRGSEGMLSTRRRLAYVVFSGWEPAQRFYLLLMSKRADRLPHTAIRAVRVEHNGQTLVGVAVIAVVSPNSEQAEGFQRAPAFESQRGWERFFAEQARRDSPQRSWWDSELGDEFGGERFEQRAIQPGRDYAERQADEALERELDRLEAEFDEKLWWHGAPGRRSKYAPKLGSVQELFAYARRQEVDPEEFARRNRDKQAERWLSEQRTRDRQRQQELDADHAEVAAALHTPRPGVAHAADEDWLVTEEALKARRGLRVVYRDAAPRPRRRRSA